MILGAGPLSDLVTIGPILADVGLQDGLGFDDVFWFAAGMGGTLAVLGFIFRKPLREFAAFLDWWRKFQRDWDGEPAHPGRDAVPGIPERMNRIDGELSHNHGTSMKDIVHATRSAVTDLQSDLQKMGRRVNTMECRQVQIASANGIDKAETDSDPG